MHKLNQQIWQRYSHQYLTDTELALLLDGTPDSRYSKIKRWVSQGKLFHIRRGLYCLTEAMGCLIKPHPFELAQFIYGPSYISLESALSYHQLIPETVYAITSACTKRKKEFNTPLGLFVYQHLPRENFYTAVDLMSENNYRFFMATPWRAICDYVYCYKKNWASLKPLLESLRVDREELPIMAIQEIEALEEYYHQKRMSRFLKGIKKSYS